MSATFNARIELDFNKFVSDLKNVENKADIVIKDIEKPIHLSAPNTSKFEGGLNKLKGLIGASLGFAVITKGLSEVIEKGSQFEASLKDFSALTGVSGKALDNFGEKAKNLALQFGTSVTENIESFKGILSRFGPDLAKSPEALNNMAIAVNTLAKASGLTATESMDALTTAALQYGTDLSNPIQASKELTSMMNVMAAGAKEGASEIPQIAEALKVSGAMGKAANVSFEELNAGIQVLATRGKTGAEAGTALRNVLIKLGQGRFLPKQTMQELEKSGVDISNLSDKTKTFQQRLEALKPIMQDDALVAELFGSENIVAGKALLDNTNVLGDLTKKLTGTQTAFEQAAIKADSFEAVQGKLKAMLEVIAINLFNSLAPALSTVMKVVSDLLTVLSPLIEEIGKSLKPILDALLPPLIKLVSTIVTKLVEFLPRLLDLLAPILEIVGSMLDILTPLIEVYLDVMLDIMKDLMVTLTPILKDLSVMIKELMPDLLPLLKLAMEGFLKLNMLGLRGAVELFKLLEPAIRAVIPVLTEVIKFVADLLTDLLKFFGLVDNKTKDIKKDKKELSKTEITPTGELKSTEEEINKILNKKTSGGGGKGTPTKIKSPLLTFIGDEKDLKEALDKQKKSLDDFTSLEDFGMVDNKKAEESFNKLVESTRIFKNEKINIDKEYFYENGQLQELTYEKWKELQDKRLEDEKEKYRIELQLEEDRVKAFQNFAQEIADSFKQIEGKITLKSLSHSFSGFFDNLSNTTGKKFSEFTDVIAKDAKNLGDVIDVLGDSIAIGLTNAFTGAMADMGKDMPFLTSLALRLLDLAEGIVMAMFAASIMKDVAFFGLTLPLTIAAEAGALLAIEVAKGLIRAKEGVVDLQGAGTETSDSIMARLSKHETVLPAWWTNIPENKDFATWSLANKGMSITDYVANMDMFGKRKENSDLRSSKSRTTNMLIAHKHNFTPFKFENGALISYHKKTMEDEIKTW